jgi:hypothetical protein
MMRSDIGIDDTPMANAGVAFVRKHPRLFRLTATTAIVGLALAPVLSERGFAQSAPPPLAPPAASPGPAPQTTADPPSRVGVLSRVVGQVSFHGIGADHWDAASLNFPVTSGNSFWTQPAGSADLGVTGNRVTMDQSTELDVATLDDHSFVATIPQGQLYLRLMALAPGETYTVTTPRGTVSITAPGRYEIAAGDTDNPTRVTVVDGSAQVSGDGVNAQVVANQTLLITGTDPFQTQVVPAQRDAFVAAQLSRERPAVVTGGVTAPAQVVQMTGGEDLNQYGTWQQAPQYGTVWYPQVAAGYVPYRNGHWAYVAPWGWTWIDAAPWGFAPFHYGRWVQIDGRWGWAPGGGAVAYGSPGYSAPVYAPALVTFLGIAAGVAVGAALAGGFGGNVGWCPLGWQEPYRPWYHASPAYVRNVNTTYVRNVTNVTTINNNNVTINNFANRGGATMVPASAMALSRPINQVARPIPAAQYAQARPVFDRQPIAPTTATVGVTPRVAQEMHLAAPPPGAGPATRPIAPGPVIRAQAEAPAARPPLEANGHPPAPGATPPAAAPNERPALVTNGRPLVPGMTPQAAHEPAAPNNAAGAAQHAPGPPIAPHEKAAVPNGTPALHPPTEAARPEPHAPGSAAGTGNAAVAPAHPGAMPTLQEHAAPHVAGPAAPPHPQMAAPNQPHVVQPSHAATSAVVHAPAAMHEPAPQLHMAAPRPQPAPHPQPAAPRPEPQARSQPAPRPQPAAHPQERKQQSQHQGGGQREPHRA